MSESKPCAGQMMMDIQSWFAASHAHVEYLKGTADGASIIERAIRDSGCRVIGVVRKTVADLERRHEAAKVSHVTRFLTSDGLERTKAEWLRVYEETRQKGTNP